MSIAALIDEMVTAGATPQLIAIAVRAIESRDDAERERKAKRAAQKAKERSLSRDSRTTVATGSSDIDATVAATPSPSFALSAPPMRDKTLTPPPIPQSPASREIATRANAFAEFWAIWPNKVGRTAAIKSFDSLSKRSDFDLSMILGGVERYVRDRPSDRPWLNPATFLNQRRWEDAPAPVLAFAARAGPAPPGKTNGYLETLLEMKRDGEQELTDIRSAV